MHGKTTIKIRTNYVEDSGSRWTRGLTRSSEAARWLGLWVRIPQEGMDVCLVSVVCCQEQVSASGLSLVQRSPTECGVSECDREALTMRRPWPTGGCCAMGNVAEYGVRYTAVLPARPISIYAIELTWALLQDLHGFSDLQRQSIPRIPAPVIHGCKERKWREIKVVT
jgi:hypothetical protein